MIASFSIVAQSYFLIPVVLLVFVIARWQSKRDHLFMKLFLRYLQEAHVYDATPRPSDFQNRPPGWGKGLLL